MSLRRILTASAVALSMSSAPALAAGGGASRLSIAAAQSERAGASVEDANALGGGFLIPLLALAAVVLGILVVVDGDDDVESP